MSADDLTTWQMGPLSDSKFDASGSISGLTVFYSDRWLDKDVGDSSGIRLYYGAH